MVGGGGGSPAGGGGGGPPEGGGRTAAERRRPAHQRPMNPVVNSERTQAPAPNHEMMPNVIQPSTMIRIPNPPSAPPAPTVARTAPSRIQLMIAIAPISAQRRGSAPGPAAAPAPAAVATWGATPVPSEAERRAMTQRPIITAPVAHPQIPIAT